MELIKVSKNVLVNPEMIASIIQKNVKGGAIFNVVVGDDSYEVEDIQSFLTDLNRFTKNTSQQFFAG